jgi:hypothetical protein
MPKLTQDQIQAAQQQNAEKGITDDKPKELKPLPVDQGQAYVYKLVACTSGLSKSSGRPQWTWEFQLDGRYHPEFVGAGYLEKIWHYTSASPGDEWAITKMFHHFGYSNDTETDELINDEATVLVYPTVEIFQNKPKMRARRFAYHDETEYPQMNNGHGQPVGPPFGGQDDIAAELAREEAKQAAAAPEPTEDPWATTPEATPVAAPVATPDPDDQF